MARHADPTRSCDHSHGQPSGAAVGIDREGRRQVQVQNLKDAFTSALVDTGSQVSVVDFDTDSHLLAGATDLSAANLDAIQGAYGGQNSDGWTNWQGGLLESANTFGGFDDDVELMIVITDGNPNTTNDSSGGEFSDGSPQALSPAIAIANGVKSGGTHTFVVAVGDSVSLDPIEAIFGPDGFNGSDFATADYMTSENYETLAASLAEVTQALCGGTVKIPGDTAEASQRRSNPSYPSNQARASQPRALRTRVLASGVSILAGVLILTGVSAIAATRRRMLGGQ